MKTLLTYSSLTGNTRKVADAIYEVLKDYNIDYFPVDEVKDIERYEIIFVGYWIDKGMPNKEALQLLKKLRNKKVGVFFTLGAHPDSEHARKCVEKSINLLEEGNNQILCVFHCQGKISDKLIEFFKTLPPDHPHALTEEKLERYALAAKHPDETDLKRAQEVLKEVFLNEKRRGG